MTKCPGIIHSYTLPEYKSVKCRIPRRVCMFYLDALSLPPFLIRETMPLFVFFSLSLPACSLSLSPSGQLAPCSSDKNMRSYVPVLANVIELTNTPSISLNFIGRKWKWNSFDRRQTSVLEYQSPFVALRSRPCRWHLFSKYYVWCDLYLEWSHFTHLLSRWLIVILAAAVWTALLTMTAAEHHCKCLDCAEIEGINEDISSLVELDWPC